jgi:chitinase
LYVSYLKGGSYNSGETELSDDQDEKVDSRENYIGFRVVRATTELAKVKPPKFDTAEDTYVSRKDIFISTREESEIRYTINGTEPTESSELYTTDVEITANSLFKIKAFKEGMRPSATIEGEFKISLFHLSMDLVGGNFSVVDTYWESQKVTIENREGEKVYYTLNGTEPTEDSTLYNGEEIDITDTFDDDAANFLQKADGKVWPALLTIYPFNDTVDKDADIKIMFKSGDVTTIKAWQAMVRCYSVIKVYDTDTTVDVSYLKLNR